MKSQKYDLVELKGNIGSDEPVFLMRAQDITAPKIIRLWAQEQRVRGGDQQMADAAELVAEQMTAWQQATGKAKLADGPRSRDTTETQTLPASKVEIPSGVPLSNALISSLEQEIKAREFHIGELRDIIRNGKAENLELKNTVDRLTSEKLQTGSNERPALGGMSISSASNEAAKRDTVQDQPATEKPAPETQPATETASSPNAS